jgi:hypothetical protein
MKVYYDESRTYNEPRLFPYDAGSQDQSGFVDFTTQPSLIESVLEDFAPFSNQRAIQVFYDFLRWINGPTSHLATSDCAFRPPGPHSDPNSSLKVCCHGRVYIHFRDLRLTSSSEQSDGLCGSLMQELNLTDPEYTADQAVVGFTKNPVIQLERSKGAWLSHGFEVEGNDPGHAQHLMLSFWAYGDDGDTCFNNLGRMFKNIWSASEIVSRRIADAINP